MPAGCRFDAHIDRPHVDAMMRRDIGPTPIERWLRARMTDPSIPPISIKTLQTHRRHCLGLGPLSSAHHAKIGEVMTIDMGPPSPPHPPASAPAAGASAPPPGPKRSEKFGDRALTDDDIEQELMRKFLDDLDRISPDKVADYMIEREKARTRGARPAKTKDDGAEDPAAVLRRKIGEAVGARPTRTGVRMRAVRGGRAG